MSLVLDSSVTLAWLHSDEGTAAVEEVFSRVTASRARVPTLWRLEVANSLTMAVRRQRVSAQFRDQSLADLALLNIVADQDTDVFAWSSTLRLADRYRLTLCDAAYLELAQRLGVPLATLDGELRAAAGALGVPLLGASTDLDLCHESRGRLDGLALSSGVAAYSDEPVVSRPVLATRSPRP